MAKPRKPGWDDREVQEHIKRFNREIKQSAPMWVSDAFDRIGQRSQADYWRKRGGRPLATKLTVRSGRLIRSLSPQGGSRYRGSAASEQIRQIRVSGGRIKGFFGSRVPYARIHEEGGTFVHPNLYGRGIKAVINMPARPYLKPAARKEIPEIREEMPQKFSRVWKEVER